MEFGAIVKTKSMESYVFLNLFSKRELKLVGLHTFFFGEKLNVFKILNIWQCWVTPKITVSVYLRVGPV